jgi:energy-coupling factor transport system permease protein
VKFPVGTARLMYVNGASPVHRLDPRTKLCMVLAVVTVGMIFASPLPLLTLFLLVAGVAGISRILRPFSLSLWHILPLVAIVTVLDAVAPGVQGGQVFLSLPLGPWTVSSSAGGVAFAVAMALRLLVVTGITAVFVCTTRYEDFTKSLRMMGFPAVVVFSLGLAFRAISYLSRDLANIIDAQRSRGLELSRPGVLKPARLLLSLFVPLMVVLLVHSREIAEAMQSRGYGSVTKPTIFRPLHLKPADYLVVAGLVLGAVLAFFSVHRIV